MRGKLYDTDLSEAAWALVAPLLPPAKPGGRPRTTCLRSVLEAILYLLRTGCQWRLLPREYPPWGTVHHHFRAWRNTGAWVRLHRALYAQTRLAAGRLPCPTLVIMDGQSVKTTKRGACAASTATSWSRAASATSSSTRWG
jgi:putative transposase